jgi:pimeloyl-ACP methyl ester carboxylesterase/DNA-binding CsgD family transcriptional regulator
MIAAELHPHSQAQSPEAPLQSVLSAWDSVSANVVSDVDILVGALNDASARPHEHGYAVVIPPSAVASVVLSAGLDILAVDPAFTDWFGKPGDNIALRRMVRQAGRAGLNSSLVEARDDRVVATCAAPASQTANWPLSEDCRRACAQARTIVILAYAPSRASDLAYRAAQTYGLTPLESRLAESLIDAPNLATAARRIGVGRETARDALRKIMRKTGAKRSPEVVRRMIDLMCGGPAPSDDLETLLQRMFGATPAEARAAARFAAGMTARDVAADIGVKEATVRGYLKAVFIKTGVRKAKDLVRLTVETSALSTLTASAQSIVETHDPNGQLKIIVRPDTGRRVAYIDYGPKTGRVVLIEHGAGTGRSLPPRFVALLQASGWRGIVPQRPGFGLTDIATDDYLSEAVQDQIALIDHLKQSSVTVLAKDAGAAVAIELACRHRDRIKHLIITNPRPPNDAPRPSTGFLAALSNLLRDRPEMISIVTELIRKQSSVEMIEALVKRSLMEHPADRTAIEDPDVLHHLVHDALALGSRTSEGNIAEQRVYAMDWSPPPTLAERGWTVCWGDWIDNEPGQMDWANHHGATIRRITNAGLLATYTNPEGVVQVLNEAN